MNPGGAAPARQGSVANQPGLSYNSPTLRTTDAGLPNFFSRGASMRRLASAFLLMGLMLGVPLMGRSADEFKLEPGFTLLFNGKNLDGWKEFSGKKEPLEGKTEAYKG